MLKPNCLELSLNTLPVAVSLSYPTSNSSANTVSSVFKIYSESDHFLSFSLLSPWSKALSSLSWIIAQSPLSAIAIMILPNNSPILIAYNIYFACSWVCGWAGMALPQAESQVHILFMYLFILGPAVSWGVFSSQQMAGAQEAKLNQASTFKISASILSIDVPLDIASHVATFSRQRGGEI